MSDFTGRVTYSRGANRVRIVEVTTGHDTVDTVYADGHCEDWRDAEPLLEQAGWRIMYRPHPAGVQVFPVERR